MSFMGKFLCVFSRSGSFLFLAIILLELTQTRSYFRMFVREPVHILENSFQSHDLAQQAKDNQSNSHKGKKDFSTFVNAIQKSKKRMKSWMIFNSLRKFFMQP